MYGAMIMNENMKKIKNFQKIGSRMKIETIMKYDCTQ